MAAATWRAPCSRPCGAIPMVRAAVEDANRSGKAIMLWNGDWVRSGGQDGKGLSAVREAVIWEVAFAPEACRHQRMHGLVLLSLADGSHALRHRRGRLALVGPFGLLRALTGDRTKWWGRPGEPGAAPTGVRPSRSTRRGGSAPGRARVLLLATGSCLP